MNEKRPFLNNQHIINFIAGLLGGFISVTICNPLDIARTRLNILSSPSHHNVSGKYTHFSHALKTIWKEEGFKGFYTGYRTNVIGIPIFHSLFFPIFQYTKRYCHKIGKSDIQSRFLATINAGVTCNIITNPIWVVRTRVMVQYLHHTDNQYQKTAPFQIIRQMIKQEGISSLFKGMGTSILSVANAVVYFQIYEQLKTKLPLNSDGTPSLYNIFLSSTISKVIASTLTYPLVALRTVMFDYRGYEKAHVWTTINHIFKQFGIRGFYNGLKPDLIRIIPSNAILFIVYQQSKKYL